MDMNQKLAELKDRLKNMSQEERDKLDADYERYIREMPYTYMWGKMLQTEKEMAEAYSRASVCDGRNIRD